MIHALRLPLTVVMTMTFIVSADAAAQATGPVTADAKSKDIQRRVLLASLSAYSPWTRQEAQEKLATMGESVEPGLVLAAATAVDDDARQRARTVLEEIRTQQLIRNLMEPTRVTLHFDRTPARQVIASLYVRAGAEPRVFPPGPWESAGDEPVTVHLDDVAFWDAMQKVEELAELTLVDAGWGAKFVKMRPEASRRRVSVRGPYRVVAEDGALPGSIAPLKIFLEPKVRVASHARLAKLAGRVEADLDPKKALALGWQANRRAAARVTGRSEDLLEVELPLDGAMRSIEHLKGTVPATLVAREEVMDELHPASGAIDFPLTRAQWSMRSLPGDMHVLKFEQWTRDVLRAMEPTRPAPQAAGGNLPDARPTLLDANGTPLWRNPSVVPAGLNTHEWLFHQHLTTSSTTKPAGDGNGVHCGPPVRMRLAVPTVTREIEIPFDFSKPDGG